jgi:anti-sigma regulatory factor (Ser/Thr protein kinase)
MSNGGVAQVSMAVRERAWSMDVPHDARGARRARQQLTAELRDLVPAALLADVVAVVAELLGNAVRHADPLPGGVIRLTCRALISGESWIELRVSDGGSDLTPTEREATPDAIDGRGLAIVAALARAWGVERSKDGQCVWAALGVPHP